MPRRTDFQAAITYTGQKITGPVEISYKIDGVRLLYRDGDIVTRNDKQPPGLIRACTVQALAKITRLGDCELYTGDFLEVSGALNSFEPALSIFTMEHVYPLVNLDERLEICTKEGLTKNDPYIPEMLKLAVKLGYEGLVLRTPNRWYRVKPSSTADVFITGWFEQHDKDGTPKGQLGGFDTNYGKVTAFSEEMRKKLWDNPEQYVGTLMQVTYKELYHTGSFRYAVTFNHFRYDKDTESFDTNNI